MLKNREGQRWLFAASTAGGVLAAFGTWALLLIADVPPLYGPLEWLAASSYGLAFGAGASLVHVVGGGRSFERAVWAVLLGTVVVSGTFAMLGTVGAAHVVPFYALPLVAAFAFAWILAVAAFVLVIPATLASLAVFGALHLVRRVVRDGGSVDARAEWP